MICLSAMGTREDESFVAIGGEGFDGMAMEADKGSFILEGFNLQQGSRSIHMRSCNEEKQKASKNYGIAKRMDLEDMRELTRRESR